MRILVVEDEVRMADFIRRGLEEEGYAVDVACNGLDGGNLAQNAFYNLIILDIILPDKNGLEVCRELREKKINTPILILTCKQSVADKVNGLNCGADDYLVKPFDFEELLARIRALLRRQGQTLTTRLQAGNLVIDVSTRQVWHNQRPLELNAKEYAILECLVRHPNRVFSRVTLEQHVWNQELASSSNLVDVYIHRLRRKLEEEGDSLIQTVYKAGYRLKAL